MSPPTETTPLSPTPPDDTYDPRTHETAHHNPESHSASDSKVLTRAALLTTLFFLIELIGGYLAGSLAIMSDAAHLLSDLAAFSINLIALSVSRLPPTKSLSFGYARAEVLGALVSLLLIWALTFVLVIAAIDRLLHPSPVNGPLMMVLGVLGLLVNITLGLTLGHAHGHAHGHSHDHHHHHHSHDHHHHHHSHNHHHHDIESPADHSHTPHTPAPPFPLSIFAAAKSALDSFSNAILDILYGSDSRSLTVRAAHLHVLGDALQNLGVILAAAILICKPAWTFLDPICTLFFAVIVIMTTRSLATETLTVLMEGTPTHLRLSDVYDSMRQIRGVRRVGDLHVWSISPRNPALSVHLYRDPAAGSHAILKAAEAVLHERFGIHHITIQVNCEDPADNAALRNGYMTCISSDSLESLSQQDITR